MYIMLTRYKGLNVKLTLSYMLLFLDENVKSKINFRKEILWDTSQDEIILKYYTQPKITLLCYCKWVLLVVTLG